MQKLPKYVVELGKYGNPNTIFRVWHSSVASEIVTRQLGFKPDFFFTKGQALALGKKAKDYLWGVDTDDHLSSKSLKKHLDVLWKFLYSRRSSIEMLKKDGHEFDVSIMWSLVSKRGGGPIIKHDVFRKMAMMPIGILRFSVWFQGRAKLLPRVRTSLHDYATLAIYHPSADPVKISAILDIRPDRVIKLGKCIGANRRTKKSIWVLSSKRFGKTDEASHQLEVLLEQLAIHKTGLELLADSGYRLILFWSWDSKYANGGPGLSRKMLLQLADLPVDLGLDTWFSLFGKPRFPVEIYHAL